MAAKGAPAGLGTGMCRVNPTLSASRRQKAAPRHDFARSEGERLGLPQIIVRGIHMSTLRIFAAVSSLLMVASPAFAASDYLLQLDPVKGEGMDAAAPQNIEVEAFSWGASNPSAAAMGSGAGAGKVNVQDLSVTKAQAPRDAMSGMATGKRAAPVAAADGQAVAVAAEPKVGDVATFTVAIRESPSKASTGRAGDCASGTHFPHAVVVDKGQRYEFSDVVLMSCTADGALMKKEFKGHVTLLK
jgi:Type VI secretion system effector, Hcp